MIENYLLQIDTKNFWTVNWYYIVAVIVSITGLILAFKNYFRSKKTSKKPTTQNYSNSLNQNNPINIVNTINNTHKETNDASNHNGDNKLNDEKNKATTKILFIDDNHKEYKMVSILKKSGWLNTKSVSDIIDLDNYQIQEADFIFVDINGVGTTMFEDQGLGLASALKKRYPEKKIIIYSAETTGDMFHKALRQVDDCLSKNAEPYQFIELIERLSKS